MGNLQNKLLAMSVTNGDCREWSRAKLARGYGRVQWEGRVHLAHRLSYTAYKGEIPKGMCVCHSCDNPSCINPDHLFLGTPLANMRDMVRKGRSRGPQGANHPKAKLTEHQAMLAKACPTKFGSATALSRLFGIHHGIVSHIMAGRIWKHLPQPTAEHIREVTELLNTNKQLSKHNNEKDNRSNTIPNGPPPK